MIGADLLPLRVRPRVWIGIAIYLYTVLVFAIQLATGAPSGHSIRGIVICSAQELTDTAAVF